MQKTDDEDDEDSFEEDDYGAYCDHLYEEYRDRSLFGDD